MSRQELAREMCWFADEYCDRYKNLGRPSLGFDHPAEQWFGFGDDIRDLTTRASLVANGHPDYYYGMTEDERDRFVNATFEIVKVAVATFERIFGPLDRARRLDDAADGGLLPRLASGSES